LKFSAALFHADKVIPNSDTPSLFAPILKNPGVPQLFADLAKSARGAFQKTGN
jgi:hypothetical protein